MDPRTTDVDVLHKGASGQKADSVTGLHPKLAIMADPNALPKEDGRGMQGYPNGSDEPADFYMKHTADALNGEVPNLYSPSSEQSENYDK